MTSIKSRASQQAHNAPSSGGHWTWSVDVDVTDSDVSPANAQVVMGKVTTAPPATSADFVTPSTFALFDFDAANVRFIGAGHWRATLSSADLTGPGSSAGQNIWVALVDATADAPQPVLTAFNLGAATA